MWQSLCFIRIRSFTIYLGNGTRSFLLQILVMNRYVSHFSILLNITLKIASFLDVTELTVLPKKVLDISHQGMFESRRLWEKVTQAIQQLEGPDWKTVQIEKTKLGRNDRMRYSYDRRRTEKTTLSSTRIITAFSTMETQAFCRNTSSRKGIYENWVSI